MTKIAILENDIDKLSAIKEALFACEGVTDDDVTVFTNIKSARAEFAQRRYDLLLLDLHLPEKEGTPPQQSAGLSFLKQISSSAKYQRPSQVVFITQFDDERANLTKEVCGRVWPCLSYRAGEQAWRDELIHRIEHLSTLETQERQFSFDCDCLFVTALDKPELEALQAIPVPWEKIQFGRHWAWQTLIDVNGRKLKFAIASAPQMGCTAAAVKTYELVTWLKPRVVLMCGITAGIKNACNLGDIIVADPCWEWGAGKHTEEKRKLVFEIAPTQIRASMELIESLRNRGISRQLLKEAEANWNGKRPEDPPQVRIGPSVSGAAVVASKRVSGAIMKQHRKLLGIEMEAYGLYYAISSINRGIRFASLKSVCDFADARKADDFQSYAAYMSARFAFGFARHVLGVAGLR